MSVNFIQVNDSPLGSLAASSAVNAGILRADNKVVATNKQALEINSTAVYTLKLIIGDRGFRHERTAFGLLDLLSEVGGLIMPVKAFFSVLVQTYSI